MKINQRKRENLKAKKAGVKFINEPKVEDKPKKKRKFKVKNPGNPIIAPKKKAEPKEEPLTATKADGSKVVIKKKDKSKKKPPTAWNKYVKKMGGVKKAAADKAGFEKFKKSL